MKKTMHYTIYDSPCMIFMKKKLLKIKREREGGKEAEEGEIERD